MNGALLWLPLILSLVALAAALGALWLARRAKILATPSPEMQALAQRLAEPAGEQLLATLLSQVQAHEGRLRDLEAARDAISRQLLGAVQKIGLKRFNADEGVGGNLSFALVLLDGRNHGLMITSLYTLESTRVFLRGIINGRTELPLTAEEQEALQQALQS